jgi:hypothetical protein
MSIGPSSRWRSWRREPSGIPARSYSNAAACCTCQVTTPDDDVHLEATGNTSAIVRLLSPVMAQDITANPNLVQETAWAKVKSDKIDARVLAKRHASGFLAEAWMRDEKTEVRLRVSAERTQLVAQITDSKTASTQSRTPS